MTSRPHDLETMQTAWRNIHQQSKVRGLRYKISFTGGEVTANKNFLPLVEWLRAEYSDIDKIQITTNGSASLNYYTRLAQVVDNMSFSTHSEFMDEAEFFSKIRELDRILTRPEKSLHVNIMNEYWNRERIKLYQEWLTKHNISFSVNTVNYISQTRDFYKQQGKANLESIE